jgi:putative oxidoreductase
VNKAERIPIFAGEHARQKEGKQMKSNFFRVSVHPVGEDAIILLIRLIAGFAFLRHGWPLIHHPLTWMGPDSSVPGFFQFLAALSEFGGAISWILGLLTRLGALGIACTMTVAVAMHRFVLRDPFVNMTGGSSYELASVYLGIALLLLIAGPGRISLDRKVFGIAPAWET